MTQFSNFLLILSLRITFHWPLSILILHFFQALAKTQNKKNILLEVWIFVEEGRVSNRINDSRIEIGVNESSKSHFIKRMHKLKLLYSYLTNSSSDSCCAVGAYRPIVYLRLALLTVHQMALWYYLLTDDRELKKMSILMNPWTCWFALDILGQSWTNSWSKLSRTDWSDRKSLSRYCPSLDWVVRGHTCVCFLERRIFFDIFKIVSRLVNSSN